MNRPYLILLFAAALFLVMIGWGLYARWSEPPTAPAAATQPTTQPPLVERLRAERERRMRERGELPDAPPTTAPATTNPA